jgi:clan AA aspartic protease
MGRIIMKIELANHEDQIRALAGDIPASAIRRAEVDGWVDTGATRLVLPKEIVDQLGLRISGKTKARLADKSTIERDVVKDVSLTLLGREGVFNAIVEPNRDDALIGAIVLEDLDMLADPVTGTCHPRDPNHIISELD